MAPVFKIIQIPVDIYQTSIASTTLNYFVVIQSFSEV